MTDISHLIRSIGVTVRGASAVAVAQLRHNGLRTSLTIFGIAIAVLATVLLASIGYGVVDAGQQKFSATGRDLWISGGPVELAPGRPGGVNAPLTDAHSVAKNISDYPNVRTATPMGFQTVYVGKDTENLTTLTGMGVPGDTLHVQVTAGEYFGRGDVHYANGSYDGPMTHSVVIDPRTAARLNLSVGGTVHIGGTVSNARQHEFTVIGISPAFGGFLGTPTVTLHLSELQELTGTTRRDPATLIGVSVRPDADRQVVATELSQTHPDYKVQTNREQLQSILKQNAVVIASGVTLVVLAIGAGFVLTINLSSHMVYSQRVVYAGLSTTGISQTILYGVMAIQGLLTGILGGVVGLALVPPAIFGLNRLTAYFGTTQFIRTPPALLAGGAGLAVSMGLAGALAASWHLGRMQILDSLD
ncbi:ABC transporter permease [Halorussus salinisoli]|uniref:ABC transporter permease n=1 Tax=Halorussus salinisoli TaxID=2558242 RepID=UPI0010C17837|nr:ABC transporter permease [Halorussus salinisoli]